MAKYIKHNSNYIKTVKHQTLKGGSTIFERDWVTVGSQLNFGPGKIPYYNNGNFLFTTSILPNYQKKHKNGVTVAMWTYGDVENTQSIVNEIKFDEHTEDIRTFAYFGSCVELVRSSVENIIKTFPGMIVKSEKPIEYFNEDETEYINSGFYGLNNEFGIDLVNEAIGKNDNELNFLCLSYDKYTLNGNDIVRYDVKRREMFMLNNDSCISNRKKETSLSLNFLTQSAYKSSWITQELNKWKAQNPEATQEEIDSKRNEISNSFDINTSKLERVLRTTLSLNYNTDGNDESSVTGNCYYQYGFNQGADNKKAISGKGNLTDFLNAHLGSHQPDFAISSTLKKVTLTITYDYSTNILKISSTNPTYQRTEVIPINEVLGKRLNFKFYNEYTLRIRYCYLQNVTSEEYDDNFSGLYKDWASVKCPLTNWTEKASFQKQCDVEWNTVKHDWNYILYSKLSDVNFNRPIYEIDIQTSSETVKIVAYILDNEIVFMTKYPNDIVIKPKDEIIEDYFRSLTGFEKQLLTRKTNPLYSNTFVTPFEYNLTYLYYKRKYTWPSNGYCIDISSSKYLDFLSNLTRMAEMFDELWTDNLWKRMTHESIKNYDWTYTREFEKGEENDNVYGGERMHKVLNIVGRVFDDVKLKIDTIKKNNRATYDSDRNMPNSLLSDKLDIYGWDVYSTIPSYEVTEMDENDEATTRIVSASNEKIEKEFLDTVLNLNYAEKWFPSLNPYNLTFADVDIEFMRRLLLSSKSIFMSKGTRNSIDMIMGLFGYGNMNEDEPNYTITEEYWTVKPIEYDDKEEDEEETFGDKIVRLNSEKDSELIYDEDASGIPVGSFVVFDKDEETERLVPTTYLIPFYSQNKRYDGDFCFQSNGGWCYQKSEGEEGYNPFKWTETLSYLHVVPQVKDLLKINPNSVNVGDIYYVVNKNDYIDFAENIGITLFSNFFVLEDDFNPEKFSSWTNLDLTMESYTEEEIAVYGKYVEKAIYLDNIIPYNIGNNPHVGYGKYDGGNEYYEYMKKPFKYSIDKNNFSIIDSKQEAEEIMFEFGETPIEGTDKLQIFANEVDEYIVSGENVGKKDMRYAEYNMDSIKEMSKEKYYINSKVVHFKNEIHNNEYIRYFFNVIIKYIMQIIPSTSIMILEGFEEV